MAANRRIRQSSGKRITGIWVLVLALFMGELFFYTWCRMQNLQVGIAISALDNKQDRLKTMRDSLKIELARLKSPELIAHMAATKMGLGPPDPRQTIRVP